MRHVCGARRRPNPSRAPEEAVQAMPRPLPYLVPRPSHLMPLPVPTPHTRSMSVGRAPTVGRGYRDGHGGAQLASGAGEQDERVDVTRAQRPKEAVVKGRELRFVQTLDHGEDGRVHEPDVGIGVLVTQGSHAAIVIRLQVFDAICPCLDVFEKSHENAGVQPGVDPVIDLHEHRGRYDECFVRRLYEVTACGVVVVVAVERRIEWAGVEDQRHERGSGRSSPARLAVSRWPEAPAPRLRGRG